MFDQLNDQQRAAVQESDKPMLVLAGAGSGKTRVITFKIAWLLSKRMVSPRNIFAVTFTNKAAREMREREKELLGSEQTKGLTVSTFHSLGMMILKEEVEASGRKPGFSIFDPADSLYVVRELLKADLDDNGLVDRVRNQISNWSGVPWRVSSRSPGSSSRLFRGRWRSNIGRSKVKRRGVGKSLKVWEEVPKGVRFASRP